MTVMMVAGSSSSLSPGWSATPSFFSASFRRRGSVNVNNLRLLRRWSWWIVISWLLRWWIIVSWLLDECSTKRIRIIHSDIGVVG